MVKITHFLTKQVSLNKEVNFTESLSRLSIPWLMAQKERGQPQPDVGSRVALVRLFHLVKLEIEGRVLG